MEATTPKPVQAWEGPNGALHSSRKSAEQAFLFAKFLKYYAEKPIGHSGFSPNPQENLFNWVNENLEDLQKILRPG
jgi:hypothetical protein